MTARKRKPRGGKVGRPPSAEGPAQMVSLRLPTVAREALKTAAERRKVSQAAVVELGLRALGEM